MAENTPKRKMQDSVFTNLFQDKKYLLQLYKALHPEDEDVTEEEIEDVTIKHVLVDADYKFLTLSHYRKIFSKGFELPWMRK